MNHSRGQRGVALIFALGILSLILVMGMAFLGNALITQKITFNNRQTASARVFARSALDRALVQLTLFNLIQSGHHAAHYASDASSVYSRISTSAVDAAGPYQVDQTQDLLAGTHSKLNVKNESFYQGKESRARWIYIHENGTESNGNPTPATESPIIARYAYQVLPQTSLSRVSLYAVTVGAYGFAGKTSADANPRVAHKYRWGIDVDELFIPDAGNMFSHWGTDDPWSTQHEFDNFQNLLSGGASGGPLGPPRDGLTADTITNRKRWLRHVFVEGRGRVAREAYHDNAGVWYTRFNLSDGTPFYAENDDSQGNWYSRLLEKKPNSKDDESAKINTLKNTFNALDRLARVPDIFRDGLYCDKDDLVAEDPFSLGLPFLTRIGHGDEKGAFETVENLRKQIAANLNDYCDSDSVPTSDVAASTWGGLVNQTTGLPSYTGNEKTLYINEVAFGFRLHKSKLEVDGGKCIFKPSTSSWGTKGEKLRAELIVELVEVYKGLPETYQTMRLDGRLNNVKLQLKAYIKGKVRVRRSGEDADADVDLGDGIEATTDVSLAAPRNFTITSFARSGRYWVGRQDLNEYTNVFHVDFTDKIKEKDGTGKDITVTSVNDVTHIKAEVLGVTFDLGNLALYLKDKDTSPTVDSYVDFVRVTPGERATAPDSPMKIFSTADGWLEKSKLTDETATDSGKCFFYGGSMQVFDPRQNLFAKLDNTAENDWYNAFIPSLGDIASPSGTPNWDSLENRKTGAKNSCSDPSAPKYVVGTDVDGTPRTAGTYDTETATDPAWLGDAAGQHVSTAVIRNRPMRSPWELGFIHRGIPFQTINLQNAGGIDDAAPETLADGAHAADNFSTVSGSLRIPKWDTPAGTKYANGDAGILDQIKMTEYNKSFGKIDVSTLVSTKPAWWVGADATDFTNYNLALYKSLFNNVRRNQTAAAFLAESENLKAPTADPTGDPAVPPAALPGSVNVRLRSKFFNADDVRGHFIPGSASNDAEKETLIGRAVNLIDADSCSPANVYRIVIVAQTVRDLGTAGKFDVTITEATKTDPEKNVYTDEILGECRMLATVEKITYLEGTDKIPRVKLRIRQIEYLD